MPELDRPVRTPRMRLRRPRYADGAYRLALLAAGTVLLGGCGSDSSDSGSTPDADNSSSPVSDGQSETADTAVYLDQLHADSLHSDVVPAEPGTAYIEVGAQRLDFLNVTCTKNDEPGAESFLVVASDEATGGGHGMYLERQVGPDIGFNFENEHVQLSLLIPDDEGGKMSNSRVQHGRDEGEDPEWALGSGDSPLVRVVGDTATAIGTLHKAPFAPESDEATFVASATCPSDLPDAEPPTEGAEAADEAPGGAAMEQGYVSVDGVHYEMTEFRNCVPQQLGVLERELELQAFGDHDGDRLQIDVYLQSAGDQEQPEVSWSAHGAVYGTGPDNPNVALDAAGTSVRGVATLVDPYLEPPSVEVEFDLPVPAETIDCR